MIKNKKGMSEVVTTLILVLLVIGAIAVVWAVVNQLLRSKAGDVDLKQNCIESIVRPTKVVCSKAGNCESITLEREGQGSNTIGGVILGIVSDAGKKNEKIAGNIGLGETQKITIPINGTTKAAAYWGANPKKVESRVYFIDSANAERPCEATVVDFTAKECIKTSECAIGPAPITGTCNPNTYTCFKCTAVADCIAIGLTSCNSATGVCT